MGHPFNTRHNHSLGGFTLIEMIVVLTIIIIVTGIAIGGQQNFNRTITLSNTAYSIALTLRESQSYGLSSLVQLGGTSRNTGYGVAVTSATSYVLFADMCPAATTGAKPDTEAGKPGNHIYEVGGCSGITSELVRNYQLNNGFTISKYCVLHSNGTTWRCSTDGTLPITELAVKFIRPEAEARISALRNNAYATTYLASCIVVRSPTGETRSVTVSSSGQIAVTNNTCP